jgi:hypothetical protein
MKEAPALAILPLDSAPDVIIGRQPNQFHCDSRDWHGRGDHSHVTSQVIA